MALRKTFRQWHLHFAALKMLSARNPQPQSACLRSRSGNANQGLSLAQILQRAILADTEPDEKLTVAGLRKKFKNRRSAAFKTEANNGLAQKILTACQVLQEHGLLVVKPPADGEDLDDDDWNLAWSISQDVYQKVKVSSHSEDASAYRSSLLVSVEAFPA